MYAHTYIYIEREREKGREWEDGERQKSTIWGKDEKANNCLEDIYIHVVVIIHKWIQDDKISTMPLKSATLIKQLHIHALGFVIMSGRVSQVKMKMKQTHGGR